MLDIPYFLFDSSVHPPGSFNSSEWPRRKVFRVQNIDPIIASKGTVMKLTPQERTAKIQRYKNKKRMWKRKQKKEKKGNLRMKQSILCISKPIFKFIVNIN